VQRPTAMVWKVMCRSRFAAPGQGKLEQHDQARPASDFPHRPKLPSLRPAAAEIGWSARIGPIARGNQPPLPAFPADKNGGVGHGISFRPGVLKPRFAPPVAGQIRRADLGIAATDLLQHLYPKADLRCGRARKYRIAQVALQTSARRQTGLKGWAKRRRSPACQSLPLRSCSDISATSTMRKEPADRTASARWGGGVKAAP